ncbi:MAG: hypothetical protein NVSMB19_10440 [Vulcanimicrobiaceae bacterium]
MKGFRFRQRDLAGEPVALTFVASSCSDSCPIADANDDRWRFASGRQRDVRRVMRAFGPTASAGRNGVPDVRATFVHNTRPGCDA